MLDAERELMTFFKSVSRTDVGKWLGFSLITLTAIQVYCVQEMMAALIIFSVFFVFVAVMALMLILLDRASQFTLAWALRACWQGTKVARENPLRTARI